MNKILIYDSESFGSVIQEIKNHIDIIKNCFNDPFTLESYKGDSKDNIELAFQNLIEHLRVFSSGLEGITDTLSDYKVKYDEVYNKNKVAVSGGDYNVQ